MNVPRWIRPHCFSCVVTPGTTTTTTTIINHRSHLSGSMEGERKDRVAVIYIYITIQEIQIHLMVNDRGIPGKQQQQHDDEEGPHVASTSSSSSLPVATPMESNDEILTAKTATRAAATTAIRNPYAASKKAVCTSTGTSNLTAVRGGLDDQSCNHTIHNSARTSDCSTVLGSTAAGPDAGTITTTDDNVEKIHDHIKQQQHPQPYQQEQQQRSIQSDENGTDTKSTTKEQPPVPGTTATGGGGADVPYWERLPSRNLSFGPAEILTVTECIDHASLYRGRCVRVTGILHRRSYLPGEGTDDLVVQLELKDPLLQTPHRDRTTQGRHSRSGLVPSSTGPTSSSTTLWNNRRRLSSTSGTGTSNTNRQSSSSVSNTNSSLRQRKRPWFATSNNDTTTGTTRVSSLGGAGVRRSGSGIGITSRSSSATASRSTKDNSQSTVLKVLASPTMSHLETALVGSIIMVIGTVTAVNSDEIVSDDGMMEDEKSKSNMEQSTVYKVEARILQVLPKADTDLTLFRMALEGRRKTLYQRYQASQQATTNDPSSSAAAGAVETRTHEQEHVLLQGCGPPPYDYLSQTNT
jgi:hypothetical protein